MCVSCCDGKAVITACARQHHECKESPLIYVLFPGLCLFFASLCSYIPKSQFQHQPLPLPGSPSLTKARPSSHHSPSSGLVKVPCESLNPVVSISVFSDSCSLHRFLFGDLGHLSCGPYLFSTPVSPAISPSFSSFQESTVLCPLLKSPFKI